MSTLTQFEYLPTSLRGVDFLPDINIGILTLKHLNLDTTYFDSWFNMLEPWKGKAVIYNNIVYTHNSSNIYNHPIIHIVNWRELRDSPLFNENVNVIYFPELEDTKIVRAMKIIFSRFLLKEHISRYTNIISDMTYESSINYSLPIIFNVQNMKIKNVLNYFDESIYFTIVIDSSNDSKSINKKSKSKPKQTNKFAILNCDSDDDDD